MLQVALLNALFVVLEKSSQKKLKITSVRGSQLDLIGDQLTFTMGLIGLFVFETAFIKENLRLILIAFFPYLIQMAIAFLKYGKATAFHKYLAKSSAVVQAVFIIWLLFFDPVYWLFYFMIVLGLMEILEEITLIFMYNTWVADVKGIFFALKDKRRLNGIDAMNK